MSGEQWYEIGPHHRLTPIRSGWWRVGFCRLGWGVILGLSTGLYLTVGLWAAVVLPAWYLIHRTRRWLRRADRIGWWE